eukprot:1465481-Amphidinium_carterae.1
MEPGRWWFTPLGASRCQVLTSLRTASVSVMASAMWHHLAQEVAELLRDAGQVVFNTPAVAAGAGRQAKSYKPLFLEPYKHTWRLKACDVRPFLTPSTQRVNLAGCLGDTERYKGKVLGIMGVGAGAMKDGVGAGTLEDEQFISVGEFWRPQEYSSRSTEFESPMAVNHTVPQK